MKKIIIVIILLVLCVLIAFSSAYNTYKVQRNELERFNRDYESYYQKEIYGVELATIINKIMNNNSNYNIAKDEKGNYIEDNEHSIKMDIYIIDADDTYSIERIYSLGTERFVQNFSSAKFKCTKLEHHEQSKKVKYLYFEQISN